MCIFGRSGCLIGHFGRASSLFLQWRALYGPSTKVHWTHVQSSRTVSTRCLASSIERFRWNPFETLRLWLFSRLVRPSPIELFAGAPSSGAPLPFELLASNFSPLNLSSLNFSRRTYPRRTSPVPLERFSTLQNPLEIARDQCVR